MFATIIIGLLLTAAAAALINRKRTNSQPLGLAAAAALTLALITAAVSSIYVVPTRNVGIVTAFNRPTGRTTGAGLQIVAPWQTVDDWDASGQTYAHLGDKCVWVAIAAQRKACIPVQVEWSAKPEDAPENWAAYREVEDHTRFEVFVMRRIDPQITAAITSVFASFDPLKMVDPNSGQAPAPNLNAEYVQQLKDAIAGSLGEDISVKSVAFEAPRYDEPTTQAIAAYGQKILERRNLAVDEANALTRRRITETNAKVPAVVRCLEIAEKGGKEPGLCFGGGNPVQVTNR